MIILVAEDEVLIAFALEWTLRLAGHRVLGPVDNVADGLTLVEKTRPDLALLDIDLRNGDDGTQLARHLHERYDTPILFTSGRPGPARDCRAFAWGLVHKPYDPTTILEVVDCIGDIARGVAPRRLPVQVEVFRKIGPG